MVLICIFCGITTPKYANIVRDVDDSREPKKEFMLSSLIFFRPRRDTKRHSHKTVSAIWSHKGGKKCRFLVQFNRVESFRDIYNGEHFGILLERELFSDRRNAVHGSADHFVRFCPPLCFSFLRRVIPVLHYTIISQIFCVDVDVMFVIACRLKAGKWSIRSSHDHSLSRTFTIMDRCHHVDSVVLSIKILL